MDNMVTACTTCHSKLENNVSKTWEKSKKPIIQLTTDGEPIKEWESLSMASKELGVDAGNICRVLKGIYKKTGGYKWQYA
jgi:uncharacterized protein YegL